MSKSSIPEDTVQKIIALHRAGKGTRVIAQELDVNRDTVQAYVRKYVPAGEACEQPGPPPDGIEKVVNRTDLDGSAEIVRRDRFATPEELMRECGLDPRTWIAQYFRPNEWQGFAKMKGPKGERLEKVRLCQSRAVFKRIIDEDLEHAILEWVKRTVKPAPAPRITPKAGPERKFMLCWGLWDVHLGMYAWQSETGGDFDIEIARRRILNSVDDMLTELKTYDIERVVMPIGNDYFHYDSVRNKTATGEHQLDTDSRFAKVFTVGIECQAYMVDRALEIAPHVNILYVPGNHDTTASFALCAALQQRFRNDPRVTVDLGANPRKYVTHGGVLLGFDHGLAKRLLAQIFATEAHKEWSASTYREIQVGHTHQRAEDHGPSVVPTNGVVIRTNPSLCGNDLWHHRQGFIGEPVKSVEAYRYDRIGFRGSHVTWARDEKRKD